MNIFIKIDTEKGVLMKKEYWKDFMIEERKHYDLVSSLCLDSSYKEHTIYSIYTKEPERRLINRGETVVEINDNNILVCNQDSLDFLTYTEQYGFVAKKSFYRVKDYEVLQNGFVIVRTEKGDLLYDAIDTYEVKTPLLTSLQNIGVEKSNLTEETDFLLGTITISSTNEKLSKNSRTYEVYIDPTTFSVSPLWDIETKERVSLEVAGWNNQLIPLKEKALKELNQRNFVKKKTLSFLKRQEK